MQCTCTMAMVNKYQNRISGPILNCTDIHLDMPRVPVQKLAALDGGEPSCLIRQRVENARAIQQARFGPINKPNVLVNGDMGPSDVQQFCQWNKEGLAMIRIGGGALRIERAGLSSHAEIEPYDCRFGGSEQVRQAHLAEALQYRQREIMQNT